jgi:4-hydroxy-tetrahydrodipicolinate synthase
MKRLEGILVVMPTPLTKEEKVDVASAKRLTKHLVQNKVHGLWVLGTGGEMVNLSQKERFCMIEAVIEEADGQVPIIVGIGGSGTRATLENMRMAEASGADALNIVLPFYFSYTDKDIVRHYQTIADKAKIPVIIYGFGGSLSLPVLDKLSHHPRIIGLKYVPGDQRYFQKIVYRLRSRNFSIFTSSARLILASVAVGGDGAVIVESMLVPKMCLDLYESSKKGDLETARIQQEKLERLSDIIFAQPSASQSVVKTALSWMGLCSPYVTQPLAEISTDEKKKLRSLLKEWRVI